jgi:hypothetical protein
MHKARIVSANAERVVKEGGVERSFGAEGVEKHIALLLKRTSESLWLERVFEEVDVHGGVGGEIKGAVKREAAMNRGRGEVDNCERVPARDVEVLLELAKVDERAQTKLGFGTGAKRLRGENEPPGAVEQSELAHRLVRGVVLLELGDALQKLVAGGATAVREAEHPAVQRESARPHAVFERLQFGRS